MESHAQSLMRVAVDRRVVQSLVVLEDGLSREETPVSRGKSAIALRAFDTRHETSYCSSLPQWRRLNPRPKPKLRNSKLYSPQVRRHRPAVHQLQPARANKNMAIDEIPWRAEDETSFEGRRFAILADELGHLVGSEGKAGAVERSVGSVVGEEGEGALWR